MQFTKPKSPAPKAVEVVIIGDSIIVSNSFHHPQNTEIVTTLKADGWIVMPYLSEKYTIEGFTAHDRRVLAWELIKAYKGTLDEADDSTMINAIKSL